MRLKVPLPVLPAPAAARPRADGPPGAAAPARADGPPGTAGDPGSGEVPGAAGTTGVPGPPAGAGDFGRAGTTGIPGAPAAASEPGHAGTSGVLSDLHGRLMRKLRVQLTDVCNFRCTYCMPVDVRFQPVSTLLPPRELVDIVEGLVRAGITEVRLTGGEPLVRKEFREIVEGIDALPLRKLGLTTNGHLLGRHLDFLAGTGCRHINVSLDSLRPERFQAITRTPFFDQVVGALLEARAMGFPVKVNVVLIRGTNDDEVEDFVDFSARHRIPVRFLEYMKIGPQRGRFEELFVPADEVIERLRLRHTLTPVPAPHDATAFSFRTDEGAEVGFIASESRPFCDSCSRLRLSARGKLRACLMSEEGMSLVGVPRERYPEVLGGVIAMKPTFRLPEIAQSMHEIGG